MDNLLDLARKFDTANTPELREQLRAAIENSTAMEPANQEAVDGLLVLGEQIRVLLGERYQEFDEKFARLLNEQPTYEWAAETVVRQLGLISASATGSRKILRGFDRECRTMRECGCAHQLATDLLISECAYHIKESAS